MSGILSGFSAIYYHSGKKGPFDRDMGRENLYFDDASCVGQSYNQLMEKGNVPAADDRVIGIMGGMGPDATIDLYRQILDLTPASKDQDHIKVLIHSNPKIPNRTEAIVSGGESPLPYLIESAGILEKGGAGIIAIACNAAHYYFPDIQKRTGIPILNMIEETRRSLRRRMPEIQVIGLLATDGTLQSGVYHRVMSQVGVNILVPEEGEQRRIQSAIAGVKARNNNRQTMEIFESAAMKLIDKGAQAIILGCTEVPLAFDPGKIDRPCLNPTRILARAAVDWALKKK